MDIYIRQCSVEDVETLETIGRETYYETFHSMNTAENMEKYLAGAFNKNRLISELGNPGCQFYFLYENEDLAGYLKINSAPAQTELNDPVSLEIERIYVKSRYKGKGLGRKLVEFAFDQAKAMKRTYVWLGVWEKNTAGISFYEKLGFRDIGRHSFQMGDDVQSDLIMAASLSVEK